MTSRILVLTDDPSDANALKDVLEKSHGEPLEVEWLRQLGPGMARLKVGGIDAVIVDLVLPDSTGIGTFDQLYAAARHTPILTLSALEDEALAVEAVQLAFLTARHCDEAQGYLFSRPVSAEKFSALMAEGLPALLVPA
jgi:DNA-binding response OmpR family regulator